MAILVTAATGTIGSRVLGMLAQRGCEVRAMSRRPTEIQVPNVESVYGDYQDAGSLTQALEGIEAVFLASGGTPTTKHPGAAIPMHDHAMISQASKMGVRKIVKLSSFGTGIDVSPSLGNWHGPGEAALRASGMAWTFLRPVAFASNIKQWVPTVRSSGEVYNRTGEGRQGVIDPRDVAAVAVHALLSEEHDGKSYTLAGPELLNTADQVDALSHALGRQIRVIDLDVNETRSALLATGIESQSVDYMIAGIEFLRSGKCAFLSDDVRLVTGRNPTSFEHWLRDNIDDFARDGRESH